MSDHRPVFVEFFDRLLMPVSHVTVCRVPNVGIVAVTLWQDSARGVRIHNRMHTLGDRREAGGLAFAPVTTPDPEEEVFPSPPPLSGRHGVIKLIGMHDGQPIESGLSFEAAGSPEFIIVAGVFPHTLAVRGLKPGDPFDPELDLAIYKRVPMLA